MKNGENLSNKGKRVVTKRTERNGDKLFSVEKIGLRFSESEIA